MELAIQRPIVALPKQRVALYVAFGLAAAVVCAFAGVVRCDFIDLDDGSHILNNPLVRDGLTWPGVQRAFIEPHASLWIPLTWISLMIDASLFGMNPGATHAVNLALHVASALLLFFSLRRMTGELWPSAAVAALYGLHPLNVESVAWATERKNVLCAVFWMLTLLAYAHFARRRRPLRYVAVLLGFALALLAKPMAVTLPCVLLLLDAWPLRRHAHTAWKWLVLEKVPLFLLGAGACWMQMHALAARDQAVPTGLLSIGVRVSNAVISCAIYLGKLCWPTDLGVFYPHPLAVQPFAAALAIVLLGSISALAVVWRRERPFLIIGWLWFLGALVPMLGLIQAGSQARADRFTYMAQIGVFIAVVWLARELPWPRLVAIAGGVSLTVLAGLTARQVSFWNDSVTLFEHTLAVTGPNPRVESLAGNARAQIGDFPRALAHYQRALRLLPDIAETWNDFGAAFTRLHRQEEAVQCFREALTRDPASTISRYNLAMALARLGSRDEAIAQLQTLAAARPDFARAHSHLGRLLEEAGRPDEAAPHLRIAAQLQPGEAPAAQTVE